MSMRRERTSPRIRVKSRPKKATVIPRNVLPDVVDLRPDPQPGHRQWTPEQQVDEDHQGQEAGGDQPVHALASGPLELGRVAVLDGPGAGTAAGEQPARVGRVGFHPLLPTRA